MESIQEVEKDLCAITNCDWFEFSGIHLAKIVKCYDGDTVHCIFLHDGKYQKFRVRIFGYDCSEMKPSRRLPEDVRAQIKAKAVAAKEFLENMILYSKMNRLVYLVCRGQDKYGRVLADIKLNLTDTKTTGDIMIETGHGYPYEGKTKKTAEEQLEILK